MVQNQEKSDLAQVLEGVSGADATVDCCGVSGADKAYLLAGIQQHTQASLCVVCPGGREAKALWKALSFFTEAMPVDLTFFPPYNITPYKKLEYHHRTAAERIRLLYTMLDPPRPYICVMPVESMLQRVIPKSKLVAYAELLMAGEEIDRDALVEKLFAGGYTRTVLVEEPGDFSVRGHILDVYSPLYDDPVRIEWFGDTIEDLRFFSAVSQRKQASVSEAIILPSREAVISRDDRAGLINRIRRQAAALDVPVTESRTVIERIRQTDSGDWTGIQNMLSLVYDRLDDVTVFLGTDVRYVLDEPAAIQTAAEEFSLQSRRNFEDAQSSGQLCVTPESLYAEWTEMETGLQTCRPIRLRPIATHRSDSGDTRQLTVHVTENDDLRTALAARKRKGQLFAPVADWVKERIGRSHTICCVCRTIAQAEKMRSLLAPYGVSMVHQDTFPVPLPRHQAPVFSSIGDLTRGFTWDSERFTIVTAAEIFGEDPRRRGKKKPRVKAELLAVEDLAHGDLVVHVDHGIGRYVGLEKLVVDRVENDFLLIMYKDDDKLYLPVDRMNMIQKYMGIDGIAPVLDKMGGQSWERTKKRVRQSVEKIAGDLLKIYAARRVKKGYSFSPPDSDYDEFEAGFAYEETADQKKAIDDVLADMAASSPMDRLVCGDVGYGKTEVALRASFYAVNDGKQVAVLVPTTVLALQHFETFTQRFSRFPINIDCISRLKTPRQQKDILQRLSEGRIDIIIGTHRLLQKDVVFRDLGLLVLDEEQRFGVRHKENLKKIRHTVDVLTLTATPIPRTLHMSLLGVRDISVISTPPEHRQAIVTYICEYDDVICADAVRKELKRGGQVFFVHNHVHSIEAMAARIRGLVPEAEIGIAHGQMEAMALEKIMLAFTERRIHVLVCTTIIESGLDIPAANTMLINRADRFGLAQMYQLRGRVGRSDEQAYAYLFIPGESTLTRDAQKRLRVLMEYSELGAGFQIAMNDLKIRGGGTILGASQSGHIAAVGYDMFLKLMESAVADLKGEPLETPLEPEINVKLSAFIPEDYIPDIDQRLGTYRRLASLVSQDEITAFRDELMDRFGPLPQELHHLLIKIVLRVLAIRAGVKRLDLGGGWVQMWFSEIHQRNPYGVVELVLSAPERYTISPDHVLKAKLTASSRIRQINGAKNILKEIARRVNR